MNNLFRFIISLFLISSAVLAQSQTSPTNQLPTRSAVKTKKPPNNPVISTQDKQKQSIPLHKQTKFYPINGKQKPVATPMNSLPKPGSFKKATKKVNYSSLYQDPSK